MADKRGTKDSQETKRKLVVAYLKKRMGTHKQAAGLFGLSKSAVDKIWTRYKTGGLRGLASRKRGVTGGLKMSGKQAAQVR
ncbi:MAG: helix-turn-helix domain-containing protein, partial [Cyclobacteriaceae bacterium]